jgi:FkbM family methyltransferase
MFDEREFLLELIKTHIKHTTNIWKTGVITPSIYQTSMELFWDQCVIDGELEFNKIRFPDIRGFFGWISFPAIYADAIMIHHLFNDDYCSENSQMIESLDCEGPYFIDDIIVKKGDVVIDAGAYVGDFSAAAAVLGAKVYAFEPSPPVLPVIREVARLNNFNVVEEALGETINNNAKLALLNPSTDAIDTDGTVSRSPEFSIPCRINTIDNFSRTNNIHIDFIKSDVEGFERFLLKGAEDVLRTQEPTLSIRIYHNDYEDKIVLPKIVSAINPNYKFRFNGHTMFATTKRG